MAGEIADQEVKVGVLVIGSEAAGARAAIEACQQGADVLVVSKGLIGKSGSTIMAGYGFQGAAGDGDPRDNADVHLGDVVRGGAYLNNQKLLERLISLAPEEPYKLDRWGAQFVKTSDGRFYHPPALPGYTYPRSCRLVGFRGGPQIRKALKGQVRRLGVPVMEEVFITRLLLTDGQVAGAFGISMRDGHSILFRAKFTILATGGCGQIYAITDTSMAATGDGMFAAYQAGAELQDMEFQQFFPMCCYWPTVFRMSGFPADLRYGLRARFYNSQGEAFMERYLPVSKDYGLRDPTSRAIFLENRYGRGSPHGGAYLGVNHLPENLIQTWADTAKPQWLPRLTRLGIDIKKQAVEVGPGCHYSMGGVRVNENCETTLPRLYAAGEVASGMDGAERLGGSALTWCFTMGRLTGEAAAGRAKEEDWLEIEPGEVKEERDRVNGLFERKTGVRGSDVKKKIKKTMWEYGSLVKDSKGLQEGLRLIQEIRSNDLPALCVPGPSRSFNRGWTDALEAVHMAGVSEMVLKGALMRQESRRSHHREDFPERNSQKWLRNIVIRKDGDSMRFSTVPPVVTKITPPMDDREQL